MFFGFNWQVLLGCGWENYRRGRFRRSFLCNERIYKKIENRIADCYIFISYFFLGAADRTNKKLPSTFFFLYTSDRVDYHRPHFLAVMNVNNKEEWGKEQLSLIEFDETTSLHP